MTSCIPSTSYLSTYSLTSFSSSLSFCQNGVQPICLNSLKIKSLEFRLRNKKIVDKFVVNGVKMDTCDVNGGNNMSEVEESLFIEGSEACNRPRRIALFVEPSPFAYISGYKNRFQNFIKYLREMGDEVMVVTTHEGVPQEFHGAKLVGSWRINHVLPHNIIHASSPGVMVFGALAITKMLCVPIVMSYHTHVPVYIPRYTFSWLVKPMWLIIKFLHRAADLTLVPSVAIARDLLAAKVTAENKIRLWNKGVDSKSFHPRFRSHEMRMRLRWPISNGEPDKPLVIHVGRLGVEKSLDFLKRVELEKMLTGMPAVFTGMLSGEELCQAYASGDV